MTYINYLSNLLIPLFIVFVVIYGVFKKVNVYSSFVSGAKDSFTMILGIFPYLLAIFVGIKTFQASGAFDFFKNILLPLTNFFSIPPEVISISIIKPLSGSASTAVFTDIVKTTGADSLASKISAVIMGSAETTFYVLAIYLGAVQINKSRYIIAVCLLSDFFGIIIAILVAKFFFGF